MYPPDTQMLPEKDMRIHHIPDRHHRKIGIIGYPRGRIPVQWIHWPRQRIRDRGLAFVQKPFTAQALLEKVRTVLSAPPAA